MDAPVLGAFDDPIVLAIPFFIVSMIGEAIWLARRRTDLAAYDRADVAANLAMGLGSLVIGAGTGLVFALAAQAVERHAVLTLGIGAQFALAVFGWDFIYYWSHRWAHEVRVFWASHVQHHSSRHYNLSVALRQEWGEWLRLPLYLPLVWLGVQPWVVAIAASVNLVYQYWLHTEVIGRLPGWFELVMNTPSHHRVHHGSQSLYLDKNYGSILIVWDRLFGTFQPETERVVYGLTKNIDSHNPLVIATHEAVDIVRDLQLAKSWSDRVGFVVRGPGWAAQRREELLASA